MQLTAVGKAFVVTMVLFAGSMTAGAANLVLNGSFENVSATDTAQFDAAGVADWAHPGMTAGEALVFPAWHNTGIIFPPNVMVSGPLPATSPDGGNFVFSDGDFANSAIEQTITGLTPGAAYDLFFFQALAEDIEGSITPQGPVTAYWQVQFGSVTQNSTLMTGNGATQTISPWAQEQMTFIASSSTQLLSFLSVGTGAPPLTMLDGISLDASAPEPAAIWLFALGCCALTAWKVYLRRRRL